MNPPKRRANTFRIIYSGTPRRHNVEEVHRFVGEKLGLTREQLVRIQINYTQNCAFVQCTNLDTAKNVVELHDNKHDIIHEKKQAKIRLRLEDGSLEVKLLDLSEDITDEQIGQHLSQYGKILGIQELLYDEGLPFAGLPTGIRSVKMILRAHIKSFISINGEITQVSYEGQRQTCRHCGEYIHNGITCIQNKKLLVQKVSVNDRLRSTQNTYAGAVKMTTQQKQPQLQSRQQLATSVNSGMVNLNKLNEQARQYERQKRETSSSATIQLTDESPEQSTNTTITEALSGSSFKTPTTNLLNRALAQSKRAKEDEGGSDTSTSSAYTERLRTTRSKRTKSKTDLESETEMIIS